MGFEEGRIKGDRYFEEIVFPKTLLPSHMSERGNTHLADAVKENREWLDEQLSRHGAILFQGFDVCSAEDFSSVVEAFGWEEMSYEFRRRRAFEDCRKEFASKVLFFCLEPPPEGGETSIVLSHVIVKKMEEAMPEFVAKLMKFGVVIQQITPKESTSEKAPRKTWQQLLQTKDKAEAIKL
ncbi:hypothetical protein AMTR_s00071p00149400 [Amborella trichopoda]|uniref:TauD/TfdA-like domain-containing protein n=1 Tax=Amborella trichopoda TaxID=13333 RepID=U5DEW7_AMBTC|nr:hypothetical protein AMTR_s00071p00149400 [Amborella trichopoda]